MRGIWGDVDPEKWIYVLHQYNTEMTLLRLASFKRPCYQHWDPLHFDDIPGGRDAHAALTADAMRLAVTESRPDSLMRDEFWADNMAESFRKLRCDVGNDTKCCARDYSGR